MRAIDGRLAGGRGHVWSNVPRAQRADVKCMVFAFLNLAGLLTQQFAVPFTSPLLNACEAAAHVGLLVISIALIPFAPPYSTALQAVIFALIVPQAVAMVAMVSHGHVATVREKFSKSATDDHAAGKDATDRAQLDVHPMTTDQTNDHEVEPRSTTPAAAPRRIEDDRTEDLEMAEFAVGIDSESSSL